MKNRKILSLKDIDREIEKMKLPFYKNRGPINI